MGAHDGMILVPLMKRGEGGAVTQLSRLCVVLFGRDRIIVEIAGAIRVTTLCPEEAYKQSSLNLMGRPRLVWSGSFFVERRIHGCGDVKGVQCLGVEKTFRVSPLIAFYIRPG